MIARPSIGTRSLARLCMLAGLATAGCLEPNVVEDFSYRVIIAGAGTGSGAVTGGRVDARLDCIIGAGVADSLSTCTVVGNAVYGAVFTATATPNPGSRFTRFEGCTSVSGNVCSLLLTGGDDDPELTVTFSPVAATPAPYDTELLVNPGFESPIIVGGLPTEPGIWQGDLSQIVTAERGVTPMLGGSKMLRFDATGSAGPGTTYVSSQQWQLVDVRSFDADIRAGLVTVNASVWFTRVAGTAATDTRFDLRILAFSGSPSAFPLNYPYDALLLHVAGAQVLPTPLAWHGAVASFLVPPGTTYLAVEIYAYENISDDATNEFDGHYADAASLILRRTP